MKLSSVRAYFSELELGLRGKPKARARLDSARAISRTTSNELKAWLELVSTAIKRAKAGLELGSPMLSSSLLYYIQKTKILFRLVWAREPKRALYFRLELGLGN
ncbi:hypothetical protein HanIR_Chr07g0325341 [Helianthus annuus]|nr:hypothetical protein HanIR_Chr07g0325341 [Helianthus annuus]